MLRINDKWRVILVSAVLSTVTVAVYWPVAHSDFIILDDWDYTVQNPIVQRGIRWDALKAAFGTFHSSNWHPLTWISHMLDVQLFGFAPGPHHLTNLLFHAANSMLLFLLLKSLTGAFWRGSFVAALFALHPMHVESVAWIAERKDVLSAGFFLLTLLAYAAYAKAEIRSPKPERNPKSEIRTQERPGNISKQSSASGLFSRFHAARFYALSLLFFAFGLMSKPMLVTTPFVLLLLDYWPLGRIRLSIENRKSKIKNLLVEKLPFLALSIISCVITFLAQKSNGAVESIERLPFGPRVINALVAYYGYLGKLLWPSNLAILYLRPGHWPAGKVALAVSVLAIMMVLTLVAGRARPYLIVGWLWLLGMLVPVIGLVQVGNQYMADRYSYLPSIGLFIIAAWGGWELASRFKASTGLVCLLAVLIAGAAGVVTRRQVRLWKNSETLLTHCLAVTADNWFTQNLLGVALGMQDRFADAEAHYLEALRLQPHYAEALSNYGVLLTKHGDYEEAFRYLEQAATVDPRQAASYSKLGFLLDSRGQIEKAIAYYREGLRWQPDQVRTCNDLAWILATNPDARLRDGSQAVHLAEHACDLSGYNQTIFIGTLAAAYAEASRFAEAITTAEKAIALADANGQKPLAERNRELLALYKADKPYHEPPPTAPIDPAAPTHP